MNNRLLALYGQMLAANARVEGMVADNQSWVARGQSPAYGEDHFNAEASHLEELATQAREEEVVIASGTIVQGPNGHDTMLLAAQHELQSLHSGGGPISNEQLSARHMGGPISGDPVEFRLGEKPL